MYHQLTSYLHKCILDSSSSRLIDHRINSTTDRRIAIGISNERYFFSLSLLSRISHISQVLPLSPHNNCKYNLGFSAPSVILVSVLHIFFFCFSSFPFILNRVPLFTSSRLLLFNACPQWGLEVVRRSRSIIPAWDAYGRMLTITSPRRSPPPFSLCFATSRFSSDEARLLECSKKSTVDRWRINRYSREDVLRF